MGIIRLIVDSSLGTRGADHRRRQRALGPYYEGYLERKERLRAALKGQGSLPHVIYDLQSSIIDPLAEMGYFPKGKPELMRGNADEVLSRLNAVFRENGHPAFKKGRNRT